MKSLIDDYDLMSCGLSNNLQDAAEYLVVVSGYGGTDMTELMQNIKTKKVIGTGESGGVDMKTVEVPYEARKVKLELDKETIAAGLLHDVLEDTVMTEEQMREEFGDEVLLLVDGVTKLQHLHLTDNIKNPKDKNADRLEMQAENLRKMFLAMAKDIRVIMIKLADRLHNMRTLKYQSKEAQQRIARETQEIYCPIAQRLGISKIKIELEDLSLKYLEPEAYYDLVEKVALRKNVRDSYVQGLVADVRLSLIHI